MFRHPHVRSALLSSLVTLALFFAISGFPGASVGQASPPSSPAAAVAAAALGPAAAPICDVAPTFNASDFPPASDLPKTGDTANYPLVPGTQYILEGFVNDGSGQPKNHKIIFTVTDLTKIVNNVRTWVVYDVDYIIPEGAQTYSKQEAELAFHVIDNQGNPWNLGEYPAEYNLSNGNFITADSTWIAGLKSHSADPAALGGWILPGTPVVSPQTFVQAYAKNVIGDCGRVSAVGVQNVCNTNTTHICYNNVTVIDENSPGEVGTQQKYYAPGVGNFKIGATDNDPQNETLEMSQRVQLSQQDCIAARNAAMALDQQARSANDTSQTVYKQSAPLVSTGLCESAAPTATPTTAPNQSVFLPLVLKIIPTPTLPPQIYDGCKSDPNPAAAPNSPVRIVKVDKIKEQVTLENISDKAVSLEDWNLCSINGNQDHDQIYGVIQAHTMRTFPNIGTPNIWDDTQRDDAALYNSSGILVSYWIDQ